MGLFSSKFFTTWGWVCFILPISCGKILLIGFFTGLTGISFLPAQSPQIDSLKSLLEEQREAKQIETYYSLAKLHQQENVDSALISLQKGLSLAQQRNLGEVIIDG